MATVAVSRREVLTLREAARYLRLKEKDVEELAAQGAIPGRRVKQEWRFLKTALADWLRGPDYKAALLQRAGAFADDPYMPEMLKSIYKQRGRPEVDNSKR
jgi:excisionase family DNA binding protein